MNNQKGNGLYHSNTYYELEGGGNCNSHNEEEKITGGGNCNTKQEEIMGGYNSSDIYYSTLEEKL